VIIFDGTASRAAETDYSCDTGNLASASGLPNHDDTNYTTSYMNRGNAISKTEWLNSGGTSPQWTYSYDQTGQMVSMIDPCGNSSCADMTGSSHTTSYTYNNYNAYLGSITYPPTNGVVHTVSFTYNSADGQLASSTDQNGQVTTYFYGENGDLLDRLAGINYPDCVAQGMCNSTSHAISNTYNDAPPDPSIVTSRLMDKSRTLNKTTQALDGVGHVTQSQLNTDPDCSGGDNTDTTYDGLGRVDTVSNPYCSSNPDPHSKGVTSYTYDAVGRTISVAAPDNSTTNTSYAGTCSTVTDPQLRARQMCSDELGRLTSVTEDPGNSNYSTTYGYTALDDLVSVTQGSKQTRTFGYDSLKRLTRAVNPEVSIDNPSPTPPTICSTTYAYDGNSNLASKIAPLPNQKSSCSTTATTTYTYDALNRITSKTYSDGTPAAKFFYDESSVTLGSWGSGTLANPKGCLTHTTTVNSGGTVLTGTVQDYDPMGRTKDYWQCTPYNCSGSPNAPWPSSYQYEYTGEVNQWTHPAGYTLTNIISPARRITQIQSSLVSSYQPQSLAQSVNYTPWGAVSKFVNGYAGSSGAQAQEAYQYNNHLQPALIELGTTTSSPTADYCLVYDYYGSHPTGCSFPSSGNSANNNGNVMYYWYQDSVRPFSHTATYAYDSVNRLSTAVTTPFGSGTASYNLSFNYSVPDNSNGQYGNMSCVTNAQTVGLCNNLSFNAANNHITTSGYQYDAAGNLTQDPSNPTAHTYQWDAEGRVSKVDGGTTWNFTYNALGHRVQWGYGSSGGANQHLFDSEGNPLGVLGSFTLVRFGERALTVYEGTETYFNHVNSLGSTSMFTDHTGTAREDMVFYPWGDVWQQWGSGGYYFAYLPYRDTTTTTDLTTARISSPNFGRWFTPDPIGTKAVKLDDPQTWNMYAYVRNNPTTLTDPTGLWWWAQACAATDQTCQQLRQAFRDCLDKLAQARDSFDPKSNEFKRLDAIIKAYGTEGVGGPGVAFGNAAGDIHAGSYDPDTKTITLDVRGLSAASGAAIGSQALSSLLSTKTAHEGQHYADADLDLKPSQREFRAFQASAWTAQGEGMPGLQFGQGDRGIVWDTLWSPGMRDVNFMTGFLQIWKDQYSSYYRDATLYLPLDPVGNK
jgi:RHS repeat-associated protein